LPPSSAAAGQPSGKSARTARRLQLPIGVSWAATLFDCDLRAEGAGPDGSLDVRVI
jgi:hypothetical protein